MKAGIHPTYTLAHVECACGNVIETRSTKGSYKVDICSNCHPFYTGKQKLVDAAGRVERFKSRYANVSAQTMSRKQAKAERSKTTPAKA